MALITVPTKDPDDELTSVEFNQFLESLKDGSRDINTLNMQASTATFTGAVNFLSDVTIGGETGPYTKFWESTNLIFVSKNGGAYDGSVYDGKSQAKALSSFQDAIDNVTAIHGETPSESNPVAIVCIDAGVYNESVVTLDYVSILAPNATLELGGASEFQLVVNNCNVVFSRITRPSGSNDMVNMSAPTDGSYLNAVNVIDSGTGAAIASTTSAVSYIDVTKIRILGGGVGLSDDMATSSHIHARIHSIMLASSDSIGISKTRPGSLHGYIDGISYGIATVTNTTGIIVSDGIVSLSLIEIKADVAYNVSAPGDLNLYSNKITGSEINTGIADVVTPSILKSAIDDIDSKEDSLGNPGAEGQGLVSTLLGVRSWATIGDMVISTYDPMSIFEDSFNLENFHGDYVDLNTGSADPAYIEGRLSWNDNDNTMNICTGLNGTLIQVGQELLRKIYNDTGNTLLNGRVVHYLPFNTGGHPHAEYAIADTFETISGSLSFITGDILPGEYGFSTFFGLVRDVDTSLLDIGVIYLSDTVQGGIQNEEPVFPSYSMYMGAVNEVGASGSLIVSPQSNVMDTIQNSWNGTIRENFDFIVTSDGGTITGTLERSGTGDITMFFSDGMHILDCTSPIQSLTLTPGSNSAPVKNYIFVPKSTKTIAHSTSDWPAEEHIRIADIILQSAANTLTYGPIGNRNWNDHIQGSDGQGDVSHIGEWIRNRPAAWYSGAEGAITITGGGTSALFSCTSGKVFQKHKQTFDSFNQLTDPVFVANDPTTPYKISTDLVNEILDANGNTMVTDFYNLVFWGVNSKSSQPDQIFMNLPNGSYASLATAIVDSNNYDIYNIPALYNGTGFLIARFTLKHANPGIWTLENVTDLRGQLVGAGGGVGSGGATEFLGLLDTPASYIGNAGDIPVVNGAETGLEFVNGATGSFTSNDGKTITVTNGIITAIV